MKKHYLNSAFLIRVRIFSLPYFSEKSIEKTSFFYFLPLSRILSKLYFYKNFCYNYYRKYKKGGIMYMNFDDFDLEVQCEEYYSEDLAEKRFIKK